MLHPVTVSLVFAAVRSWTYVIQQLVMNLKSLVRLKAVFLRAGDLMNASIIAIFMERPLFQLIKCQMHHFILIKSIRPYL